LQKRLMSKLQQLQGGFAVTSYWASHGIGAQRRDCTW
jgi:hypothetical protein